MDAFAKVYAKGLKYITLFSASDKAEENTRDTWDTEALWALRQEDPTDALLDNLINLPAWSKQDNANYP